MRIVIPLFLIILSVQSISAIKSKKSSKDDSNSKVASDLETDLSLTTLSIAAKPDSDAVLSFHNGGSSDFILALERASGSFIAKNEKHTILEARDSDKTLTFSSTLVKVENVNFANNFQYQGTRQWKLAIQENFWEAPSGWSIEKTSTCAGVTMLGGYKILSIGNLTKTLPGLPTHSVIRLVANVHFIDAWDGQMAYLFADIGTQNKYEYLWTQWIDASDAKESLSVCGSEFGEAKFTNLIDVTFAHTGEALNLIFGTTADEEDSTVLSWGISSFEIYIL